MILREELKKLQHTTYLYFTNSNSIPYYKCIYCSRIFIKYEWSNEIKVFKSWNDSFFDLLKSCEEYRTDDIIKEIIE